jgi:hypothetical protein
MTYRNLSIQRKLRLVIMATVGAALTLACAAFLIYGPLSFRDYLICSSSGLQMPERRQSV